MRNEMASYIKRVAKEVLGESREYEWLTKEISGGMRRFKQQLN